MGDDKVRAICDEFWEWRMRQSPEFASYCGDQRYCHLLDETDTEAFLDYEVLIILLLSNEYIDIVFQHVQRRILNCFNFFFMFGNWIVDDNLLLNVWLEYRYISNTNISNMISVEGLITLQVEGCESESQLCQTSDVNIQ
jgi:hypothetical protein